MTVSPTDAMNDALEQCADLAFEMAPGFCTHWAMGSDSLIALGHPELVHDWVAAYPRKNRHLPRPPHVAVIDPADEADWRAALGDFARVSDWGRLFERELAEHPWREVLATWWPRLIGGVSAGLTHGLIRTTHAIRGIDRAAPEPPTRPQLRELATGLAFWAGHYVEQPAPTRLTGDARLPDVIATIPRLDPERKIGLRDKGLFRHMPEIEGWGDAVGALAEPADVEAGLSDLTAAFARVQLAHPDIFPIPLVHTITAPAALRVALRYVPEEQRLPSFAAIWQADAALLASFAEPRPEEIALDGEPTSTREELVARAVEHADQHVLKLTEACLREHAVRPDPAYLQMAERLMEKVPPYYRSGERPAAPAR